MFSSTVFETGDSSVPGSLEASGHGLLSPVPIREGEIASAVITPSLSDGAGVTCRIWSLSPLGVDLVDSESMSHLDKGALVNLKMLMASGHEVAVRGEVVGRTRQAATDLLAVKILLPPPRDAATGSKRLHERWLSHDLFFPTGAAANPNKFNDFVYFTVSDLSPVGMGVVTSLRNKTLFSGVTLECSLNFPATGQASVLAKIVRIEVIHGQVAVGLQFIDPKPALLTLIGQYVLQFGTDDEGGKPTVASLRSAGLTPSSLSQALDFDFARTQQDYDEVCDLRLRAYASVAATGSELSRADWADAFDSRSRILVARHGSKIVGSLRVIYSSAEQELELEKYMPRPQGLPHNVHIVETSRMCTDDGYRKSDLMLKMISYMCIVALQSGRLYILANCTEHLLPIYRRVGFKTLKETFVHQSRVGTNKKHFVIFGDLVRMVSGLDIGLPLWTTMFAPQAHYLVNCPAVRANPSAKKRLAFNLKLSKLVGPFLPRS